MVNTEIEKKYRDVQTVLEDALGKASTIEIAGQAENIEFQEIIKTLESLNVDFQKEIEKLKTSSEWDRFCIAFFGETNAGKSTIIDSLRIIYDEETRRAAVMAQQKEYCTMMIKHCQDYQGLISSLEAVNIALKSQYGKNNNWIFYLGAVIAGLAMGLILANMGIIVW